MTNVYVEAACWRVCYRLDVNGPQKISQLRSNLNIEGSVLSDAIRTLEKTQVIEMDNGKWQLKTGEYGTIMKVNPRIQR